MGVRKNLLQHVIDILDAREIAECTKLHNTTNLGIICHHSNSHWESAKNLREKVVDKLMDKKLPEVCNKIAIALCGEKTLMDRMEVMEHRIKTQQTELETQRQLISDLLASQPASKKVTKDS